jgi:hypothetical protein
MSKLSSDRFPTRLAGVFAAEFICTFMIEARILLKLDYDEILIASFIVSRSLNDVSNNKYDAQTYGFEDKALPEIERIAITMKEIVSGLEIPRQTLRRKLDSLINKGVILKIKGGYIFPPQIGSADISSEFRKIIEISLQKLINKLNLIHVIKY